jgi:hypothetical protein
LREALEYEPGTGRFFWREKSSPFSNVEVGAEAGFKTARGYQVIKITSVSLEQCAAQLCY